MHRFTLREPKETDIAYLHAFNASEGMDFLESMEGVTIAADEDDDPIGYVRVMHSDDGQAYINPIVVNPLWRRRNVGRALMEKAMSENESLRLVSRGPAIPFYSSLGFEECDWSSVDPSCAEDCSNCTIREECRPLPMEFGTTASADR